VPYDADDDAGQLADSLVYHIPCPKGHVLDVREDLLGQQVVCPTCNTFFVLRATDSIEYRREQKRRRQLADERRAESWLKVAIWAAVIVGFSFIVMIVLALNPGLWRQQ
jgi:acetyl-CoA carboxylase beta subunit